jgi:hypothetical protein
MEREFTLARKKSMLLKVQNIEFRDPRLHSRSSATSSRVGPSALLNANSSMRKVGSEGGEGLSMEERADGMTLKLLRDPIVSGEWINQSNVTSVIRVMESLSTFPSTPLNHN